MLQISWDYLHWPQSDPTYEEGAVDNAQLGEKQVEASKARAASASVEIWSLQGRVVQL